MSNKPQYVNVELIPTKRMAAYCRKRQNIVIIRISRNQHDLIKSFDFLLHEKLSIHINVKPR